MYRRETNILSILAALAIGGLVGAGIALLMAPQSGQETRALIRDKSNELKDKAIGTAEDTRARAEKAVDQIANQTRDRANELKKRSQDIITRGKNRTEEVLHS